MISFYIKDAKFSAKNADIYFHIMMLLKYFKLLKTIVSYSGSSVALEHNSQISAENPLIDSETSSLYLLAYNKIDYKAAPLHLKTA